MKIIGMKEFLKLPNGTMYQRYQPCCFTGELEVFEGSIECTNDFYYKNIINEVECEGDIELIDILSNATTINESFKFDYNCGSRDGHCCDDDQLFAIYDKEDVKSLLDEITKIYNNY